MNEGVNAIFYQGYLKNEQQIKSLNDSIVFVDVDKTDDNPSGRQAQTWTHQGVISANPGDLILFIDRDIVFIKRESVYPALKGEVSKVTKFKNKQTGEIVECIQYLPKGGAVYHKELGKLIDNISYSKDIYDELFLYTCIPTGERSMIVKDSKGFVFPVSVMKEFYDIYELVNN